MFKTRRIATLVAGMAAAAAMAVLAASASAGLPPLVFENWKVSGTLTDKKLNEPIALPAGSTFNGVAEVNEASGTEIAGTLHGKLAVPPFKAKLKIAGLLPSEVGVTLTEVGESTGTLSNAPANSPECTKARFKGFCTLTTVTAKTILGLTVVGVAGVEVPVGCHTAEPITLNLTNISTLPELVQSGPRFTGVTTIPSFTCEGLQGLIVGPAVTLLVSGPENPYNLLLNKQAAPMVETNEASSVSQISAVMHGSAFPNGEPITGCQFEYGTTPSYGASTPCVSGEEAQVSAPLVNLNEGTTYHYRVVATNAIGTTKGPDQSVTTLGSAGAPEYGQCVEQEKGEFTESACKTRATKASKGEFSFKPGPAPACVAKKGGSYKDAGCTVKGKGKFEKAPGPGYTSTSGSVTLETPGLGGAKVVCASSTDTGEVTGLRSGVDRITLSGCEMAGKKCTSEGTNSTPSGASGVIDTNRLATTLLGPVSGQVWNEIASSEHEPYAAEFGCEGPLFRTSGSAAGVLSGDINTPSLTSTTTFAGGEGEQGLSTERSEDGGKTWTGPSASGLAMVASNSAASLTDIRP
jgi:hypothetical protein